MTRSVPYKIFRGRKIKDAAWNKLVETPLDFIEDDADAGIALLNAGTPRGCFLTQGGAEQSAKHWRCHFYVAKEQRVIGRGSAYQCAKLYDYALFYLEKYRARKTDYYNFSKLDAESDMNFTPAIGQYLAELENYLLGKGILVLPGAKRAPDKEKLREQRHRRTAAGALEHWIEQIQPHIFDIADGQARLITQNESVLALLDILSKRLIGIEAKLDAILKNSLTPPADAPILKAYER